MRDIKEKLDIKVLNYGTSFVNLETGKRSYSFEGAVDGIPTVNFVPFPEIEYAHARSAVFKTGILVFDAEMREEVYAALNMLNWKETVWSEQDIENTLLRPSSVQMRRVLDIRDIVTIDRIRSRMNYIVNHNETDISHRVIDLVNDRYAEITHGKVHSALVIRDDETFGASTTANETEELKREKERLEQELKELRKELKKNSEAMTTLKPETDAPKKPGRKPNSSTTA